MLWTAIQKPTASVWTTVNPMGKEQYDQASLSYDDSGTFYDGVNTSQWTEVSKPNLLLGNLQWGQVNISWSEANSPWDSGTGWRLINKPS